MRITFLILTLTCLSISSAYASPDNWENYQYNASHTGFVKTKLDFNAANLLWKKSYSNDISNIAINNKNLYFNTNHVFYALDKTSGNLIWSKTFTETTALNPPLATDDNVYFENSGGDQNHIIFNAYEANTGDIIFSKKYSGFFSSYLTPTLYQNNIYTGCGFSSPGLCAFDSQSGDLLWQNDAVYNRKSNYNWTPAVTDDYVITYTNLPKIFDRNTGKLLTTIETDENPDFEINFSPVVATDYNSVIYVKNHRLAILNLETKDVRYSEATDHYTGQPVYAHGVIYAINNGLLTAVALKNGKTLWQWQPEDHSLINKNLILTQNVILAANDDKTYAIDLSSHHQVWQYNVGGNLALSKDQLFIVANKTDTNKMKNIVSIKLNTLDADLTVSVMKTRIPSYFNQTLTYTPEEGLHLLDGDLYYTLNDGTNVRTTLTQTPGKLRLDRAYKGLDGNLHFTFKTTDADGKIFEEIYPYNSYKGSIQGGTLKAYGNLEMIVNENSNTATLYGVAKITNNPPHFLDHEDSDPVYYAGNVGDIILFKMTYEIQDNVWTLNTFKKPFVYRSEGEVNIAGSSANTIKIKR